MTKEALLGSARTRKGLGPLTPSSRDPRARSHWDAGAGAGGARELLFSVFSVALRFDGLEDQDCRRRVRGPATCHPALRARAGGGLRLRPVWIVCVAVGRAGLDRVTPVPMEPVRTQPIWMGPNNAGGRAAKPPERDAGLQRTCTQYAVRAPSQKTLFPSVQNTPVSGVEPIVPNSETDEEDVQFTQCKPVAVPSNLVPVHTATLPVSVPSARVLMELISRPSSRSALLNAIIAPTGL